MALGNLRSRADLFWAGRVGPPPLAALTLTCKGRGAGRILNPLILAQPHAPEAFR